MAMKLAVWNTPPGEFFVSGITSGAAGAPIEIVRLRPEVCAARLLEGKVDVALLPTMLALQGADGFEFVPDVALSAWKYPFARIVLKRGLREAPQAVAYDRRAVQERQLAQIVLHEHYRFDPSFDPREHPATEELLGADAALLVGSDVPTLKTEYLTLDLGREWYELTNYPMVWGLLTARKEQLTPTDTRALRHAVRAAEQQRAVWVRSREMPERLHEFFSEDLRLRFDDLVTASLTTLKEHLFYYDVLDDLPSLSFAELPEEENDGNERRPLV